MTKAWIKSFHEGLIPLLTDGELTALRDGLANDDPRLIQNWTTRPAPIPSAHNWPVEGACLIGYAGWIGGGLETVGEVESFFNRICWEADSRTIDSAIQYLLYYYDENPREVVFRELLSECNLALAGRQQ